jgi:hypothetical protein
MAGETEDKGAAGAAGGVADTKDQALGGDAAKAAADAAAKAGEKPAQALDGGEKKPDAKEGAEGKKDGGEKKPDAKEGAEGKKDGEGKKDDKPSGPPEKYEDFKLPEGVTVDAAQIEGFKGLAKELGLTQEAAQKLVDFQAANEAAQVKKIGEFWDKQASDWLAEAKADKEFGGAKFDESVAAANAALKQFGTPKLIEALQTYGMGNHPEVIRAFARVGQAIQNDKLVPGGKDVSKPTSAAEALYPSMRAK